MNLFREVSGVTEVKRKGNFVSGLNFTLKITRNITGNHLAAGPIIHLKTSRKGSM